MKPKACTAPGCNYVGKLWRSKPALCRNCAMKADASVQNACSTNKYRTSAIKKSRCLTLERIRQKQALNVFFAAQALQVPENCENCQMPLNAFSLSARRFVTAHILPKNDREFPSVATHPQNRMFLGHGLFSECNCHDDWDKRDAAARIEMPCYKLAIERYQSFKNNLQGQELSRSIKYLGLTNI